MGRELREVVADWLMVLGAVTLALALFLPWSHAATGDFSSAFAGTGALAGVSRDPSAWEVYSVADVLILLVALYVLAMALAGPRRLRLRGLAATAATLVFVLHAAGNPPTNGLNASSPVQGIAAPPDRPQSGAGETVAVVALIVCAGGLILSLTADP